MDLFGAEGDGEKVEGGAAVAASDFHVRGYNVGGKRVYWIDEEHDGEQDADVYDCFEILVGCDAQIVDVFERMGADAEVFFL